MKAILMAAGRGSRISRHIGNQPKCTLNVGGTTLIRFTVNMLIEQGIEVVLVVGYQDHAIREALEGLPVKYYVNPFYDVTNSIASLWFAREEIGEEDLILANADVYWDETILNEMLGDSRTPLMLGDSSRKEEGDYRFKWDEEFLLEKHGKELEVSEITGEYVGIALLRKQVLPWFKERLSEMIGNQEHSVWWENVLYSAIGQRTIHVKDIHPLFWGEVDYIEDYNRIVAYRRQQGLTDFDPSDTEV